MSSPARIAADTPGPDGSPLIGVYWYLTVTAWRKTTEDYGLAWTRMHESQPPDGTVSFGVKPKDICRLVCPVIDADWTFKIPEDARGVIPVEQLIGEQGE
jgi:hypothetical protein